MTDFNTLPAEDRAARLEHLARASLPHWGIDSDSDLKLLGFRENAVFRVTTPGGTRYAIRVHRAGYHSPEAVRSELTWTDALASNGVYSPAGLKTTGGDLIKVMDHEDVGVPHVVDVLEWFDGAPPAEENVVENFLMLGEINARIHDHAQNWVRPDGFDRHAWDAEGLLGAKPLWGHFAGLSTLTADQRGLFQRAQDAVRTHMSDYGTGADRYGLIHADLMPENIMVRGKDVRVIDFDDGGFGWFMYDPATALFMHRDEDHYEAVRNAWIEGYRKVLPLSDEDLDAIDALEIARGLIGLGWAHTRPGMLPDEFIAWFIDVTTRLATDYLEKRS